MPPFIFSAELGIINLVLILRDEVCMSYGVLECCFNIPKTCIAQFNPYTEAITLLAGISKHA